jgi:(S)-citramalyl-CoA lyase
MLFVPATRPDRVEKAYATEAGAIIVDLEDAVAPAKRAEARDCLAGIMARVDCARLILRINSPATIDGIADLQMLLHAAHSPAFIMVPKSESAGVLRMLDAVLADADVHCGLLALVETARGLCVVEEIAASCPRVVGVMFGAADMASDITCAPGSAVLEAARHRISIACSAVGKAAIDSPALVIDDVAAVRAEADRARDLGFDAKAAIHPSQIAPINASYQPDAETLERARKIVTLAAQGVGVLDGELIDEAMAKAARTMISRWGKA